MRRVLLLLAGLLCMPTASHAQSEDSNAVYAVVINLFHGMRTRDTTLMRASFDTSAQLQSIGAGGVQIMPISSWINSVASAPAGLVLDERLSNPRVQIKGDLASVWVDYWFFAGERFSHCGVDAFVLARVAGTWKILSVADTRQREGCEPAPGR